MILSLARVKAFTRVLRVVTYSKISLFSTVEIKGYESLPIDELKDLFKERKLDVSEIRCELITRFNKNSADDTELKKILEVDSNELNSIKVLEDKLKYDKLLIESLSFAKQSALCHLDKDYYGPALFMYEHILRAYQSKFDNDPQDTNIVCAMLDVADVLVKQNESSTKLERAFDLYSKVLAHSEEKEGKDDILTMRIVSRIAKLLTLQNKLEEAEVLYRRITKTMTWEYELVFELNDFAKVLLKQEKVQESRALYDRALQLCMDIERKGMYDDREMNGDERDKIYALISTIQLSKIELQNLEWYLKTKKPKSSK